MCMHVQQPDMHEETCLSRTSKHVLATYGLHEGMQQHHVSLNLYGVMVHDIALVLKIFMLRTNFIAA